MKSTTWRFGIGPGKIHKCFSRMHVYCFKRSLEVLLKIILKLAFANAFETQDLSQDIMKVLLIILEDSNICQSEKLMS